MPYNTYTMRGQFSGAKPEAGRAVLQKYPVLAIVKDNRDLARTGKLRVLLISENTNIDPNDERSWLPVNYSTPFYGQTEGSSKTTGLGSYTETPNSYGMWTPAPDIGTMIICVFIEGRPDYGFFIASVPRAESLSMLPGISSSDEVTLNSEEAKSFGGAKRLPTVNINPRNPNSNTGNYYAQPRPVHSYQAAILYQQGLIRDELRGTISSNAQRESPSRVLGISSPGRPIYEGGYTDETIAAAAQQSNPGTKIIARRGGHTFVMDDGDLKGKDNLVRLRSANGHTILMSDDGQTLFIIHSNGQSWVELGKEGTVDVYATNSINLRTMGDLNLHADNDININAGNQLNLNSRSMKSQTEFTMEQRAGTDFSLQTTGKAGIKVGGDYSVAATGVAGLKGSKVFIEGQPINLNTGSAPFVPGDLNAIPVTLHPDAVYSTDKGWLSSPLKLPSIVSRAPTHQPWPLAGMGVGVDVKMTEAAALPAAPKPAVQNGNTAAQTAAAPTPQPGAAKTVPTNNSTTGAQAAVQASQTNPPPAASGVGKVTPQQAETAGYIKPGTAATVEKLLSENKPIPNSLLTNKEGVNNWSQFQKNAAAQANAISATVDNATKQLVKAGSLTGSEDPKATAGVTLAAAVNGVNTVQNYLQTAQKVLQPFGVGNQLSGALQTAQAAAGQIGGLIKGGNIAAAANSGVTGLLGNITGNITGSITKVFDNVKNTVTGIFNSIKNSIPTLKAGEPQNLRKIAEEQSAKIQASVSGGAPGLLGTITGGISTVFGGAVSGVTSVVKGVGGAVSQIGESASKLTSGITNIPKSAATIQSSAVGGDVTSIADAAGKAQAAVNTATTAINGAAASGLSNLPGGLGAAASLAKGNPLSSLSTGVGGLLDKAKGGASSLIDIAKSGVPAAQANEIQGKLAALSTSAQQVKVPEAATDTNDSTSQLRSAFGSFVGMKVPLPPTGSPPVTTPEQADAKSKAMDQIDAEAAQVTAETERATNDYTRAKAELNAIQNSNSPEYAAKKAEVDDALRRMTAGMKLERELYMKRLEILDS